MPRSGTLVERFCRPSRTASETSDAEIWSAIGDERRSTPRYRDGAFTRVSTFERRPAQPPTHLRGRRLRCPASADAVILDVNGYGMRIFSRQLIPSDRRVSCRIDFATHARDVGLRVVWTRACGDGYEYGATYVPVVPGTEHVLDTYAQFVNYRGSVNVSAAPLIRAFEKSTAAS